MIIGIDASRANRTHKSGTEWYSYYLIKYFAQLDSADQFILYTDRPLTGGLLDLTKVDYDGNGNNEAPKFDEQGYQIIKSPHHNFKAKILHWPFSYFWTLGRLTWEMIWRRPDILFIPAHGLPLVFPKKTINTIHDVAFKREAAVYESNKLGPEKGRGRRPINFLVRLITLGKFGATSTDYLDWSTAYALKHAKKIIAVSQFTKDEILQVYRCVEKKITVVENGFNNLIYGKINDDEKIASVLAKYGLSRPFFLYVGRLERKKNTPFLIESFARFKYQNRQSPEKLVLIGDASFGFDEIKYIIHEFDLENEVLMPGWIDEEEMPYIFNGADTFILPSRHEGFGITILQALACGVPAIASDIPVLREVAGDAALFFDASDKEELSALMKKIITNENLRASLINKGLARAKEFSWERCARETLQVLLSD
ncbi:MAG TPA: glycosyltransferase family 1 protein [Candidatus Methylomirabilis sp.]|nr:glycosyltransferase family 1 protein [Candidatus Methylomirabilis sp.]